MQSAASIVACVNDNTLLQVVFAQDVRINIAEAGIVHAFYMHIAQPSVRQPFHLSSPAFDPPFVEQVGLFRPADGQHHLVPCASTSLQAYQCFLAGALVQQLCQVGIFS